MGNTLSKLVVAILISTQQAAAGSKLWGEQCTKDSECHDGYCGKGRWYKNPYSHISGRTVCLQKKQNGQQCKRLDQCEGNMCVNKKCCSDVGDGVRCQ